MSRGLWIGWAGLVVLALVGHGLSRPADAPLARVVEVRGIPETAGSVPSQVSIELEVLRAAPSGGPPVFWLHLRTGSGEIVRNLDREVACWMPGSRSTHRVELEAAGSLSDLEPGSYRLVGGLWDPGSGRRWSLRTAGDRAEELLLGDLRVPPRSPAPGPTSEPAPGTAEAPESPAADSPPASRG